MQTAFLGHGIGLLACPRRRVCRSRLLTTVKTTFGQWLQRIAAQTKANLVVNRDALDDPDLAFKREGGDYARLDRIFAGELQPD